MLGPRGMKWFLSCRLRHNFHTHRTSVYRLPYSQSSSVSMQPTLPFQSETSSNEKLAGSSGREESRQTRLSRLVLVVVLIIVGITGFFAAAFTFHFFDTGTTNCWARPTTVPADSTYFVVVMANEGMNIGFNGSKFHSGSWPIMNITLGRNITIHVINNDTVQSHGFTIQHYFSGFALGPGRCGDVTFTANQLGSFLVYCYISCTIHELMQSGKLNVNP
jgi:heme/copper-type cytochrome/quinol oxidase subunit 2